MGCEVCGRGQGALGEGRGLWVRLAAPIILSMPKVLYFADPSNKRPGVGATIKLDSGEPCIVSIAQSGVRVKKTRLGFFGAVLYEEKVVYIQGGVDGKGFEFSLSKKLASARIHKPCLTRVRERNHALFNMRGCFHRSK
jgi:hypothetical protein